MRACRARSDDADTSIFEQEHCAACEIKKSDCGEEDEEEAAPRKKEKVLQRKQEEEVAGKKQKQQEEDVASKEAAYNHVLIQAGDLHLEDARNKLRINDFAGAKKARSDAARCPCQCVQKCAHTSGYTRTPTSST